MYSAMLLNVAGIPFGTGAAFSVLGAWIVVAAFLTSILGLAACVDRRPRLTSPDRRFRGVAVSRTEETLWGLRARCAEITIWNA